MAGKQAVKSGGKKVVPGEGQFLIVAHADRGYRVYSMQVTNGQHIELTIPPGVEVVCDEAFLSYAPFVRDWQGGLIELRRDDAVPSSTAPAIDPQYAGLPASAQGAIRRIVFGDITPEVEGVVDLHKLLRDGTPLPGTSVTKRLIKEQHVPFLKAAIDLEKRCRNRQRVIARLGTALKEAEAI